MGFFASVHIAVDIGDQSPRSNELLTQSVNGSSRLNAFGTQLLGIIAAQINDRHADVLRP
jgi:hypothetical protein